MFVPLTPWPGKAVGISRRYCRIGNSRRNITATEPQSGKPRRIITATESPDCRLIPTATTPVRWFFVQLSIYIDTRLERVKHKLHSSLMSHYHSSARRLPLPQPPPALRQLQLFPLLLVFHPRPATPTTLQQHHGDLRYVGHL